MSWRHYLWCSHWLVLLKSQTISYNTVNTSNEFEWSPAIVLILAQRPDLCFRVFFNQSKIVRFQSNDKLQFLVPVKLDIFTSKLLTKWLSFFVINACYCRRNVYSSLSPNPSILTQMTFLLFLYAEILIVFLILIANPLKGQLTKEG